MWPRSVRSRSQANYAATCAGGGYATDLADLVRAPSGSSYGFISPDLVANDVEKSGYRFALARNAAPGTFDVLDPTCNGAVQPRTSSFYASAVPVVPGRTGRKYFATDTPGTIYMDPSGPLTNPIPFDRAAVQIILASLSCTVLRPARTWARS